MSIGVRDQLSDEAWQLIKMMWSPPAVSMAFVVSALDWLANVDGDGSRASVTRRVSSTTAVASSFDKALPRADPPPKDALEQLVNLRNDQALDELSCRLVDRLNDLEQSKTVDVVVKSRVDSVVAALFVLLCDPAENVSDLKIALTVVSLHRQLDALISRHAGGGHRLDIDTHDWVSVL